MPAPLARYRVYNLADLIVAVTSLTVDARLQQGRQPADVKLRKPAFLTLNERTVGDGTPHQVLVLDIR